MICLQGEERRAITLPDLEHIDVDAARAVRWNRRSIWYTTDDSEDTYKSSDRVQTDTNLWNEPGLPSVTYSAVPAWLAQQIKSRVLRCYTMHFAYKINRTRHETQDRFLWDEVFHQVGINSLDRFGPCHHSFHLEVFPKSRKFRSPLRTVNRWDVWRSWWVDMCQVIFFFVFFFFRSVWDTPLCVAVK